MSSSCSLAGVLTVSVVCEYHVTLCCSSRAVGNKFIYRWGIGKNPELIPDGVPYIYCVSDRDDFTLVSIFHAPRRGCVWSLQLLLSLYVVFLSDNLLAIIPKPDPIIPSVESFSIRIILYHLCCQRAAQVEKNDWVASFSFLLKDYSYSFMFHRAVSLLYLLIYSFGIRAGFL